VSGARPQESNFGKIPPHYMSYGSPCWDRFPPPQVSRLHRGTEAALTGRPVCGADGDCTTSCRADVDASGAVDLVVDVVHKAGLSTKVARMRPIGVIQG
jgi:hypothetical protein